MSELEARLRGALDDARRAYAAYRPAIARYLFEEGFVPAARALGEDEPDRDAVLLALFRLQLESIGSRGFGVSQPGFREDPSYPDRYFAQLWLDLVPGLLPLLPASRRLPTLVALFNLGEHLSLRAPGLGGAVVDRLLAQRGKIVDDGVESVALRALVDLGVLPSEAAPLLPSRPHRLVLAGIASVAQWEPQWIPAAVVVEAGTLRVFDRVTQRSLRLAFTGGVAQLLGRDEGNEVTPSGLPLARAELEIDVGGIVRNAGVELGVIDPRGLLGVASDGHRIAVSRRFSQRVELYELSS